MNRSLFADRKVLFLVATFCCLLWGSAYPAIKAGYAMFHIAAADVPSKLVFAGYRFLFAGLLLAVFAWFTGRRAAMRLDARTWGQVTLLGLTQTLLQYIFFYVGLAYTTGVKGSIMNATGTFFSVLLAHLIYHNDRLSHHKVWGCIVGFAGVMVVNFTPDLLDVDFTLLGEGFVVIAAFVLSAASIYGKRVSQHLDSVVMTGYQLAIGGAALLAAGFAFGGQLTGFTAGSVALLAYMVLLSALAFTLWSLLLRANRVSTVAAFNFLVPIFGAALSALFLDEAILEWRNLIALVLVCGGIWLVTREPASGETAPRAR